MPEHPKQFPNLPKRLAIVNKRGTKHDLGKDFGKLSADGSNAFQDLTLTRVALFDGRIDDAKKYIKQAENGLG